MRKGTFMGVGPIRILAKAGLFGLFAIAATAQTPRSLPSDLPPRPEIPAEVLSSQPKAPPPEAPPTTIPDSSELYAQLELLYDFLNLSPQHLQRISRTIALIERLSPEERTQMRKRLERMQLDLGGIEEALAPFSSYLAGQAQLDFRRFWISMPPSERRRLTDQLATLEASERPDWVQAHLQRFYEHEQTVRRRLEGAEITVEQQRDPN